jgi:hypothetical protein
MSHNISIHAIVYIKNLKTHTLQFIKEYTPSSPNLAFEINFESVVGVCIYSSIRLGKTLYKRWWFLYERDSSISWSSYNSLSMTRALFKTPYTPPRNGENFDECETSV